MRDRARSGLADEAEQLQTQINEFIGHATMARVDLPAALYDANAELLLLPARLREQVRAAAGRLEVTVGAARPSDALSPGATTPGAVPRH